MSLRQILLSLGLMVLILRSVASAAPSGHQVDIEGAIGPAMSMHLEKALERAREEGSDFLLMRIDTPGGLDGAMRDMIKAILASPIPVIAYVGPEGARAASAGTFLMYASHVAAMAPATNLGAATPIPIGGGMPEPQSPAGSDENADGDADAAAKPADAAGRKAVNDAVAYIRSLAEKNGRNADWAELAVREGASLAASEALEQGVIDLLAPNITELLNRIDGREVSVAGREITLATAGAGLTQVEKDWRIEFLSILTNPTVAYMLLLAGIYGLLLEGYNPGAILPGVIGAICLLLALFALQVLPVNYAGLGLILLGIILIIAEALVPSFGVLGFGGVAAFVIGSVMLMDADVPGYEINLMVIAGVGSGAALLMLLTIFLLMRSRHSVVVTGENAMVGATAEVMEAAGGQGWAWVASEQWRVRGPDDIRAGDRVRVTAMDGLTLIVAKDED